MAFGDVFKLRLDELMLPPDIVVSERTVDLIDAYRRSREAVVAAWDDLTEHVIDHPAAQAAFEREWQSNDWSRDVMDDVLAKFREVLRKDVDAFEAQHGRRPTLADVQQAGAQQEAARSQPRRRRADGKRRKAT